MEEDYLKSINDGSAYIKIEGLFIANFASTGHYDGEGDDKNKVLTAQLVGRERG